jgi:superfamily II DNA/RNA helicase
MSRELAQQIALVASEAFQDIGVRTVALIGGANVQRQIGRHVVHICWDALSLFAVF